MRLHLSNRKILQGFLAGLGLEDTAPITRILDKLDKLGAGGVATQLTALNRMTEAQIQLALRLCQIRTPNSDFVAEVSALGVAHPLLAEGLQELAFVMDNGVALGLKNVVADLSIVRGFDYYTGTVYEGKLMDYPDYGSVISGGRYEDLAGHMINKKLPGVGISLGLSRLFAKLLAEGKIPELQPKEGVLLKRSPTDILVVLPSEELRPEARRIAHTLRQKGYNTEMYYAPSKLKKQMAYAEKKGIPLVWFPPFEVGGEASGELGSENELKNMENGTQNPVSLDDFPNK